jgi:hypothetical protein
VRGAAIHVRSGGGNALAHLLWRDDPADCGRRRGGGVVLNTLGVIKMVRIGRKRYWGPDLYVT